MSDLEKRITAKFILDSSGFNNSIKGVNAELKNSNSAIKLASQGLKTYGSDSNKLKSIQTELARNVELHAKKIDIYKQSMEKASAKMQENINARDKVKASLDQANKSYEQAVQMYGKESEQAQKAKAEVEKLSQEYNNHEKTIQTNAKSIQNYDTQMNKAATDMAKAQEQLNKVSSALETNENKWAKTSSVLKESSEKLNSIGSSMSSAGDNVLKFTAPLAVAGGAALKVGMDFESGMSKVSAISGATGEDFQKLKDKAQEMGATTKFSATEASEAMQYMGMAGWKAGDMIDGVSGIMNLAAASGEDLALTSDIVTDALTAFGMSAADSGHFSDILASASSNANTNVAMLGESFKYVAPLCGSLGYSAEDASVALSLMANAGIKGSQSGTSLKTALVNMTSPTDAMAGVMGELGIEITKEDGSMKSLHDTLDMLREKFKVFNNDEIDANFKKYADTLGMTRSELESLSVEEQAEAVAKGVGAKMTAQMTEAQIQQKEAAMLSKEQLKSLTQEQKLWQIQCKLGQQELYGLTQEQQASNAATLFGKESMAGMLSIINASESDYNKLTSAINNCDGVSQKMADTMNDNLEGQLTLLKSQLEGVGIQLSQTLIPIARDMLTTFSGWIDAFAKLSPETQSAIVKMAAFGVATGGALKIVGGGISTIGSIAGGLSKLTGVLGTITAGTKAAGVAAEVASGIGAAGAGAGGLAGFASGLGTVALAAAPYALAIGGVAAAGYAVYKGLSQEVVPQVDLFADKMNNTSIVVGGASASMQQQVSNDMVSISDSTKQAVQGYLDLDESAKFAIQDLYINSTPITDQIVTETASKFNEMKDTVINGYEQQKNDSLQKLNELFDGQDVLTAEEQAEITQKTTEFYTNQETQTTEYHQRITDIMNQAKEEHRSLTEEEVNQISELQNQMKDNAVKSLSDNELEAKVILQRMKDYDGQVTAEQCSQHIQKLNESRDQAVQTANDEYEKKIATIIKMRDETGSITAEQADKMIENAKRQKDETVRAAEETRDSAVDKIKSMNSDLEQSVNTSTGEIKTKWDRLKDWWDSWKPSIKIFSSRVEGGGEADSNWTGNESFKGGYTTLHERGYELYSLPQGTRIYNHEASEDIVLKTAESVAEKVANRAIQSLQGAIGSSGDNTPKTIIVPVSLDGEVIAQVTAPYMSEQLAFNQGRGL